MRVGGAVAVAVVAAAAMLRATCARSWRRCAQLQPAHAPAPASLGRLRFASSEKKEEKPSRWQQIKTAFIEHGPAFVATYATLYTAGLGVAYTGVCLSGLDAQEWIKWSGVEAAAGIDLSGLSPRLINGVIALEMNELAEFVRLPTVLLLTPKVTRLIRGPAAAAAKPATAAKPVLTTRAGPGARRRGLERRKF